MDNIKLDTAKLDEIVNQAPARCFVIVQKYGFAIASSAAQNAPVDTGALRNSILSESHMENNLLFIAQDGVEYGIFQELGTSRMGAHPFMIPAVESWQNEYFNAFGSVFE